MPSARCSTPASARGDSDTTPWDSAVRDVELADAEEVVVFVEQRELGQSPRLALERSDARDGLACRPEGPHVRWRVLQLPVLEPCRDEGCVVRAHVIDSDPDIAAGDG